jgi:hypothetical protein
MSARAPRRSFLSPFVVTLAAAPACFVQSATPPSQPVSQPNPGQPETTDPKPSPPPPEAQTPTYIANPPRPMPSNPPPPQELEPVMNPPPPTVPDPDQTWYVTKTSRGCQARSATHCPPKAMCNPPPPHAYHCVDDMKYPATIEKRGEVCTVENTHVVPCPS